MTADVHDARPPKAVVQLSNPVLSVLLRTRAGSGLSNLARVQFTGRRSGRRLAVIVGWHAAADGTAIVFTPARWRANFADGAPAQVHWRGHREERLGTLDRDAASVATELNTVLESGTSPRALGLRVPRGQAVTAEDVTATGRAMIRFGAPTLPGPDPGVAGQRRPVG
jgi:hypothetical protein